ncbi:MAG: ATP-binding protein [Flavipsychrobacter sp.]|nr:ATP-binding protein [Flavipsychrobacter sp.]
MKIRSTFLLFMLLFIFCAGKILAQDTDISSLLKTLHSSKPDTDRSKIYTEIAAYYQKRSKQDSSYYFLKQGLSFANSIDDKRRIGRLLEIMGALDMEKTMYNKALQDYTQALNIHKEVSDIYAAGVDYLSLGRVAVSKGDYAHATSYYLEALKRFESIGDKKQIGAVYMSLGMTCDAFGENKKALNYLLKSQEALNTVPFSVYHLQLMNNLGLVYHQMKDYDASMKVLSMGIAKSTAPEYAFVRAQLLSNASSVLYDVGQHKEAIEYLNQTLELTRKMNFKESECYALVNLAETRTDSKQALAELQEALAISQEIDHKYLQMKIYESLAEFYKKRQRFAEALDATDKKNDLKDSILSKQKLVEIADLQSTSELEQSNNKVNNLMLINSRDEFRAKLVIAIAAGIGLVLIIGGFYYRKVTVLNKQLVTQGEELKELNNVTIAQTEELKELNTVKDKIFSVIGHDLRSPLGNIISMLQVMEEEDGVINDEYRPYVNELRLQSLLTLDTLDKLLYWGKNSFKGIVIQQQIFTVDTIIKSNIGLLTVAAQQKNITVTDEVPAGTQIFADVSHFDFVTRNLFSNALKFTPPGGSIHISATETVKPGFTVFAVHDTGVGMSQEEQDHLFSLDLTSKIGTQEEVGTGIGLLLCKEFVEKNGGELWVISKQGDGSTFYFSFKTA